MNMKNNIEEQEIVEQETNTTDNDTAIECEEQIALWQNKYMRLSADFDNFRKRTTKEQVMWRQHAQKEVLLPLLDIVDNFDRALARESTPEVKSWLDGFVLIRKSLDKLLHNFSVKRMDNYHTFDPVFHEALVQVDSPNHATGDIVEVVQPGYLINDSVLRPARVTIAK
jgi:molecular chaperone GrpE